MFDSFKKETPDTIKVEVVEEVSPIVQPKPTPDTIYIYRVIVSSFKIDENADRLSESIPLSDIIIKNGYFMVSKSYHFDIEDAIIERDLLKKVHGC